MSFALIVLGQLYTSSEIFACLCCDRTRHFNTLRLPQASPLCLPSLLCVVPCHAILVRQFVVATLCKFYFTLSSKPASSRHFLNAVQPGKLRTTFIFVLLEPSLPLLSVYQLEAKFHAALWVETWMCTSFLGGRCSPSHVVPSMPRLV